MTVKFAQTHEGTPPWTRTFADIALRGILHLHLDYLLWSTPQKYKMEDRKNLLVTGPGVALADEPTVCAAISQEFMSSRAASGGWIDENTPKTVTRGPRHYRLRREVLYPATQQRADILIERIDPDTDQLFGDTPFSYIEAKRAARWATKLDGSEPAVELQHTQVQADIEKLNSSFDRAKDPKIGRGYILVWNITGHKETNITPATFFADKAFGGSSIWVWQLRAAPLCAMSDTPAAFALDAKVHRWLWLALAEVTPLQQGDLTLP